MALKDAGIDARVVGHQLQDFNLSFLAPTYEVVIGSKDDVDPAKAFLDDWAKRLPATEPIEMDEDAWVPDLSTLDPDAFGVDCPHCTMPLPMDAAAENCPSCGGAVDVVEIILQKHGPEALMHAEAESEPREVATAIGWDEACVSCKASLRGQAFSGRCPGCGSLYAVERR